jgi:hypothetical protein
MLWDAWLLLKQSPGKVIKQNVLGYNAWPFSRVGSRLALASMVPRGKGDTGRLPRADEGPFE